MNQISRNHNISDIDLCLQGTCDTGIDDGICLKIIHQDLGADSRIDFSDAASYHNNLFSAENALTKFHMGFLYGSSHLHVLFEGLYFYFHRSDDTYCTHVKLSFIYFSLLIHSSIRDSFQYN